MSHEDGVWNDLLLFDQKAFDNKNYTIKKSDFKQY